MFLWINSIYSPLHSIVCPKREFEYIRKKKIPVFQGKWIVLERGPVVHCANSNSHESRSSELDSSL